jgi:glutamate-1-semialdehyde 2,1-aminomutase
MSFGAFERLESLARRTDLPIQATGVGSILCIHFPNRPITRPVHAEATQPSARAVFHLGMLQRGFCFARRSFIGLFLPPDDSELGGETGGLKEPRWLR